MSTLNKLCLSPSSMLRIVVNDQRANDGGNQLNYRVHQEDKQIHHHHRRSSDSDEHSPEHESDDEFITNIKITPTMFLNMCPALLVQIEQGACSEVTKMELGKEDKAFTMGIVVCTPKGVKVHLQKFKSIKIYFSLDIRDCFDCYNISVWLGWNCNSAISEIYSIRRNFTIFNRTSNWHLVWRCAHG